MSDAETTDRDAVRKWQKDIEAFLPPREDELDRRRLTQELEPVASCPVSDRARLVVLEFSIRLR
jgi:hypothetical protein